jgi:hypothetical protein
MLQPVAVADAGCESSATAGAAIDGDGLLVSGLNPNAAASPAAHTTSQTDSFEGVNERRVREAVDSGIFTERVLVG